MSLMHCANRRATLATSDGESADSRSLSETSVGWLSSAACSSRKKAGGGRSRLFLEVEVEVDVRGRESKGGALSSSSDDEVVDDEESGGLVCPGRR